MELEALKGINQKLNPELSHLKEELERIKANSSQDIKQVMQSLEAERRRLTAEIAGLRELNSTL